MTKTTQFPESLHNDTPAGAVQLPYSTLLAVLETPDLSTEIKRQAMYLRYSLTLARSITHCRRGNAISIIYCEWVFIALGIQHAIRTHHIVICGLPGSTTFSTLSHKRPDFREGRGGLLNQKKLCFFSSTTFIWSISHSKKNSARYYHKCTQDFLNSWFHAS